MRYKFVSSGQNVDDALVVTQTLLGNSLKPLAPVNLRGSRNSASDLLIEWTRRERNPLPLRDYAGTPNTEEREIFVVEIYSGSTLKRTFRLDSQRLESQALRWVPGPTLSGSTTPTFSDDGVSWSGASLYSLISEQKMLGDFELEFGADSSNTNIPNNIWIQRVGTEGTLTPPVLAISRSGGLDNTFITVSDQVNSLSGEVETDLTYPNRFFIVRTGTELKIHFNAAFQTSHPFFTAAPEFSGGLTVMVSHIHASAATLFRPRVSSIRNRSCLYTALMQVNDFGSTQSSIKVRVYQESAIVGKGQYIEANL